jgi:LysM repeat protein
MEDLDTHPAGFDSESPADPSGGSNKLILLALGVGVVGILLGVTGIYLATQSANALDAYRAEVRAAGDPAAEALGALEALERSVGAKFDDVEGRLGNMGGSIVRLQRQGAGAEVAKQIQDLRDQTQSAFDAVSKEVQANRVQLNETNSRLEQLVARGVTRPSGGSATASPATSAAPASPAAPALEAPAGGSIHTVESGETMVSIARRYGITLGMLMQANPSVEPRRMQIGDSLVIPPAP